MARAYPAGRRRMTIVPAWPAEGCAGPPPQEDAPKRSKAFPLAICERVVCSQPLEESRRHGSARRFCSPRCRRLAWHTRRVA